MAKVSVIIPIYNSSKYLSETIESVLAQTFQDFEVVAVDDGSTDISREIIQGYIEKYPDKMRYIYQENRGIAGARNTGIKNAKGEFIALLDADDKWYPSKLQECVKVLESSNDVGLVHTDVFKISENGELLPVERKNKKYLSGYLFRDLFLRNTDIYCSTVLFRKECCGRVGLLDEDRKCMGCDDKDLWLRIAKQYKIAYVDKVLACWRCHENNFSKNYQLMLAARIYVANKFKPVNLREHILKHRGMCIIYKESGDKCLFSGFFDKAKKHYLTAMSNWPFNVWPYINCVKSILRIKVSNNG